LTTGAVVGVANNLINNLPLALIAGSTLNSAHVQGVIQNAVLIAVDLGPNLSVTGSLATILWLIAIRREGLHVGFGTFLKVGVIAMPVALALALVGAALL
jgi:arsenical pump membrane protein